MAAHGDLGGDFNAPSVLKINGISVSGTPSVGQSLIADSSSSATWQSGVAGSGSVTSVGSTDANITVANPTSTPALTLATNPTFLNATNDGSIVIKTGGSAKGAFLVVDSTGPGAQNIQGKVSGTLNWIIGRANSTHTGFNVYTGSFGGTRTAQFNDSGDTVLFGNVTISSTKTLTLSGSGGKVTTPSLQINTASAPSVGQVWTATDTSGNASWQTVSGGGSGTVTSTSVVSANGFTGTVATPTTTPAITLTTSVTGLLKGNGTAISAATSGTDYSAPLVQTATKTSAYTTAPNELVIADASAGAFAVTLPSAPTDKSVIAIKKIDSVVANAVIITCGGTDVFTTTGATTTTITLQGQTITLEYNTSTGKWTSISNDIPLSQLDSRYVDLTSVQTAYGAKTFRDDTNDAVLTVKATAATHAASIYIDSATSTQSNIQGRLSGVTTWYIGRAGHGGFNIYTAFTQAFNMSDTQVATFYGDVTMTGAKNLILSTTTGTKIATATTQKLGFWNATPIVQPTGNVMTALTNTGLVASPTLAESDITNLTTDLAAKAALASPALTGTPTAPTATVGTNTTQIATTAFVLANPSTGTSITGIIKGNGTTMSAATAGTDYLSPTGTATVTNKRNTKRVVTVTQSATPTINTDNTDVAAITGLAQAITDLSTNLTGTPAAGDVLIIEFTDDGTGRAITHGTKFESSGTVTLPPTTVAGVKLTAAYIWNAATSKWRVAGVS